ncbi:MAG TPA: phosphodiesterase [Alphaproteobacteria bacterium]|nr:phosphodiesterase [Alphaproteobacteria bacterium]
MLIAQLTDLHVRPRGRIAYERVDTNAMLEAAIGHLSALDPGPDVVLMTGDLTDCGLIPEYELLRELIAPLEAPVYLVPGNHDRRENLRAVFGDAGYLPAGGEFLHFTVEDHPVRLIGLDTVVPGKGHGEMCAERLAWLEARLEEDPERPTVLFLHHPPFATGIPAMDTIGCRNAAAFGAVVARYPAIERVLCGHHHRPIQARWHGTLASVAPSTAHQVELDLSGRGQARFNMEPPGYQLHLWREGAGLSSHTVYVGAFEGPYPFLLDADYPAFAAES